MFQLHEIAILRQHIFRNIYQGKMFLQGCRKPTIWGETMLLIMITGLLVYWVAI